MNKSTLIDVSKWIRFVLDRSRTARCRASGSAWNSPPKASTSPWMSASVSAITRSTSSVERGSPQIELANDPPTRYRTPHSSRASATRSATSTGSAAMLSIIRERYGFGVDPVRQFTSEFQNCEAHPALMIGCLRMAPSDSKQRKILNRPADFAHGTGFLQRRHSSPQPDLEALRREGGVGRQHCTGRTFVQARCSAWRMFICHRGEYIPRSSCMGPCRTRDRHGSAGSHRSPGWYHAGEEDWKRWFTGKAVESGWW